MNQEAVQQAYEDLGFTCGWRFMTCPEANLTTARVALVTLNPGEGSQPPPNWSMEDPAVSYFGNEKWETALGGKSPLQVQVQRLAKAIEVDLGSIFSAQYVPFCTRRWDDVTGDQRRRTLEFSRKLWRWTLGRLKAQLVIAVGKGVVGKELAALTGAPGPPESLLAGWGKQTIERWVATDCRVLVSVPHLSRYRIFDRNRGAEDALRRACGVV